MFTRLYRFNNKNYIEIVRLQNYKIYFQIFWRLKRYLRGSDHNGIKYAEINNSNKCNGKMER